MVYGKGINDADYYVRSKGGATCPYYTRWMAMLQRCYDRSALLRDPCYVGAEVCEEWLYFSNFKAWMEEKGWDGKCLDKDLKGGDWGTLSAGKLYSPDTCVFITPNLNKYWTSGRSKTGGLQGASYEPDRKKWKAKLVHKNLGRYATEEEAHRVYVAAKKKGLAAFLSTESPEVRQILLEIISGA